MWIPHTDFSVALSKLYSSTKKKGTVYVTMKRFTPKRTRKAIEQNKDGSPRVLVRAQTSKKKISTWVRPESLEEFHETLNDVMRVHFDSLEAVVKKKRVKKKRMSTKK
jgi:hypothetical protein